ncbi:AAA domain-containing protein [Algoriphagus namhaensis]
MPTLKEKMQRKNKAIDYFDELLEIHSDENILIHLKYVQLRTLLEKITKELTSSETLQFSNLFSRLSFICEKFKTSRQIHSFRVAANKVLHENVHPSNEEYQTHFKYLSEFISKTCGLDVPEEIQSYYPTIEYRKEKSKTILSRLDKVRVEIIEIQHGFLLCETEKNEGEEYIRIRINEDGINATFKSVNDFWIGAQLYLINIEIDESEIYHPKFIILEPDYLVDISSIAECFKEHGNSEYNFLQSKFTEVPNNKAILLGNFANMVIDELFSNKSKVITFKETFFKHFKSSPFEYTSCSDIFSDSDFKEFASNAEMTFNNIQKVFKQDFPKKDFNISIDDATLEPSFMNENFGIQGRLDIYQGLTQNTNAKIIELKSGSVPRPDDGLSVSPNHKAQLFQYYQIIAAFENIPYHLISKKIDGHIMYSKIENNNLRPQWPSLIEMQEIFDIRNRMIVVEKNLTIDLKNAKNQISNIKPDKIVHKKKVAPWIIPRIENFQKSIFDCSTLEKEYFFSFVNFIAKEQYLAKLGNGQHESNNGLANLWINSFSEKVDKFEILYDLIIETNKIHQDEKEIGFLRTNKKNDFVNFRNGDICVLYPKASENDNVTSNQIFKCSIKSITKDKVVVIFRYKQRNTKFFEQYNSWALERDFMDSSFTAMYRNIYAFLNSSKIKRDLILTTQEPKIGNNHGYHQEELSDEQNRIINKALSNKDYFLLNGPPGTGKTSIIVKELVRELYRQESCNILLLAYTNRAVDELCETINNAIINFPDMNDGYVNISRSDRNFIRIGSELSCSEEHRHNLLKNIIEGEARRLEQNGEKFSRDSINVVLSKHRIFISTVASISSKTDIFKIKKFDVVIVDEASQILEPQIVGILPKCSKFVLIGDHKQLPAIVLQDPESSKTSNEILETIGLENRKNSLFERLYNYCEKNSLDYAYDKLTYQGRMHKEIALFPNHSFYNSELKQAFDIPNLNETVKNELRRQIKPIGLKSQTKGNLSDLLSRKRIIYFPSKVDEKNHFGKSNDLEADLVVKIVGELRKLYTHNNKRFDSKKTIGIIAPFRNQIARLKQKLEEAQIPNFEDISVDTVERYQGSQRDIIIFSFAINNPYQLNGIINLNDEGTVDRKLNVALTRAKEQLILIGNDSFLSNNLVYFKLIEFIKAKGGYVWDSITDVLNDNLQFRYFDSEETIEGKTYIPDYEFATIYDDLVINKLKYDPRTLSYPDLILGETNDFIRNRIIEYGRANFDQPSLYNQSFTTEDKVNLYCYYNMRKHYFSGVSIFDSYKRFFEIELQQVSGKIIFIDFGCGPLTSGIAFNQTFKHNPEFSMKYVGIDISNAMLNKASEFSKSILFKKNTDFKFLNSFKQIEENTLEDWLRVSNLVVLNFSYLFANLDNSQINDLVNNVNQLVKKYSLNKYVLVYQNPVHRHHNFMRFKNHLKGIDHSVVRKSETVSYKNSNQSRYDKAETFTYEILSN